MAMTDAEPLFIDTNILIYANMATAPLHEPALNAIAVTRKLEKKLFLMAMVGYAPDLLRDVMRVGAAGHPIAS